MTFSSSKEYCAGYGELSSNKSGNCESSGIAAVRVVVHTPWRKGHSEEKRHASCAFRYAKN